MTRKKFDAAIIVGRFQPLHKAHLALIGEAAQISDTVIIIVGSVNQPRTFKNPFSFEERKLMITQAIEEMPPPYREGLMNTRFFIEPLEDTLYNDNVWNGRVQAIVDSICPLAQISLPNYPQEVKTISRNIAIVGHEKDESSSYLHSFPQWKLQLFPSVEKLSATEIRTLFFTEDPNLNFVAGVVPKSTLKFLREFSETSAFEKLVREVAIVEAYKKQFATLPYPPTFVTADSVIIQSGHILLIRRLHEPGAGLWALPGGFLNVTRDKSMLDCAIRELREETGLKVPEKVLKGSVVGNKVFDAIDRSSRGRTITHAFFIQLADGELPRVKGSDDADKAKWIPLGQLNPSEMFEDHAEIINYFTGV